MFIPHQANKRIIDAAARKCGIEEHKVLINIEKYGNTTAGTIPIAMNEAINEKRINDGDYILLSSFGLKSEDFRHYKRLSERDYKKLKILSF